MPPQIPLPFAFHKTQNFSTFLTGPNGQIVDALKSFVHTQAEPLIFLWGDPGQGKTHLLQACCRQANELEYSVMYVPMRQIQSFGPAFLTELDLYSLVCIDDVDTVSGDRDWELGLFNFFNRHRDHGCRLLLSATTSPANLGMDLPDLATRLSWGLTLRIHELQDSEKVAALMLKAETLGFEIPENVGQYLLSRYSRDMPSLWTLLDELEHATLAAKRRLTIPFLKTHLRQKEADP